MSGVICLEMMREVHFILGVKPALCTLMLRLSGSPLILALLPHLIRPWFLTDLSIRALRGRRYHKVLRNCASRRISTDTLLMYGGVGLGTLVFA
jgi:hypothetical protein